MEFGEGEVATTAAEKVERLIGRLGLSDAAPANGVVYEIRFRARHEERRVRGLSGPVAYYPHAAYAGIRLGGGTEYLLISGHSAMAVPADPRRVVFVTGGALGNAAALSEVTAGKVPPGSVGDMELTFYEKQSDWLSATLVSALARRLPKKVKTQFVLDFPWGGHYGLLAEAAAGQPVSSPWYDWTDGRVEARRTSIDTLFRVKMGDAYQEGSFRFRDELEPIRRVLHAESQRGRIPSIGELVDAQRASGDRIWGLLLDPTLRRMVGLGGRDSAFEPGTFREMAELARVAAVIRAMQGGALVVSVSDRPEDVVQRHVDAYAPAIQAMAPRLKLGTSLTISPFARIVPAERGQNMFHYDPGSRVLLQDPDGLTGQRHGHWIDPSGLLPEAYRLR